MPFLTIGAQTIEVSEARQRPSELIGSVDRAWAGNFLGDVRDEKEGFGFTSAPMSQAAYLALRALNYTLQACGGDALFGVARTCLVELGDVEYLEDYANNRALLFVVPIVLRED